MSEPAFVTALQKVTSGSLPLNELIVAAQQLGASGQPDLARQLYQIWIAMNGEHPLLFIAHFNCSTLLAQGGDNAGALASLRAALTINPDFAPAHINLGSALERAGDAAAAVEQWKAGLERMATVTGDTIEYKITLLKQLSRVLSDNQQHEAAEVALQQCLDLGLHQRDVVEQYAAVRLAQCKWPIATTPTKLTRGSFVSRFHPLSSCAYSDDPLQHLGLAHRYAEAVAPAITSASDRRHAPIPQGRRPRIGYVSSDLRAHAVGYLMANLFEAHDTSNVEVFIYYCGIPADDGINQRIKAAAEHWADIRNIGDDEAAALIAADEIDILIDVNGHTRDARLGIFARRPAPIQVNWLGYPGSMGSPYHHYIIGDEWVIPQDHEVYYSERVLRLPCYQPNDRKRIVDTAPPQRSEHGLPEDAFVFCCFNAAHKVTRYSFERWMAILNQVPNSVIWLLDYNTETNTRLRAAAERYGVSGDRLIFAKKVPNPRHLARYPLADLFLDTAPYGAHTTASDALWMGVPVLTYAGRSFASRVCASLVRAAGAPELITTSPDAFIKRAIALATTDQLGLKALRQRLTANRDTCTLFDIDGLARNLEGLYAQMAGDYRAGHLPKPNTANLDAYLDIGVNIDHDSIEIGAASDYHGVYRAALAVRHYNTPMQADGRLWTENDIGAAEAAPINCSASRAA
ncbi:tetratricopeptide repeat protein [Candidatus Viadribacter manganicus]|uniref:O-linked N-acetylglucosamine transferase, SPINDLY family protein n=1 Tax=Candidatus Viadribacter manganicus TaxID=1759059 RepID=UPI00082E10CC|nr:tetratricopeptide repeat protein [Candidatus Viadribacter manganicus]